MRFAKKGWLNSVKILIDTNIIIDYLVDRIPFADYAERLLELCMSGEIEGFLTANAVFGAILSALIPPFGKATASPVPATGTAPVSGCAL